MKIPTAGELLSVVHHCGKEIRVSFGTSISSERKDDDTLVTKIDHAINKHLLKWSEKYPDLGFIGEEGNGVNDKPYVLFVDPLDGTAAFLRGMATCTVIASIMKIDGHAGYPVTSIIYNPITDETWYAERAKCSYKICKGGQQKLIRVKKTVPKILTSICSWPGASHNLENISHLIRNNGEFDNQPMGALGIGGGLIAQGTIHATACGLGSALEIASMSLIVNEAGGKTIDLAGKEIKKFTLGTWKNKVDFLLPNGAIVASSMPIAKKLLEFIKNNQQE